MAKKYINPGPISFKAKISRNTDVSNSSAWIDFPYDLKDTYGVGNLVPFKATFDNRVTYQGSIAKMGGPQAKILLRKDVREQLGKGPGDSVEVIVELDDTPREIFVPPELEEACKKAGLWQTFQKLAFSHRREFARYIEEAKKPETKARRVIKAVAMLADNQKLS